VQPSPPAPPVPAPAVADHQPPGRLSAVTMKLSATGVALTWKNPADADLDHVVITRNAHHRPHGPGDGRRTVLGKTTRARLAAERGERFHLSLYAYDHAGNVSQATSVDVTVPKVLPAPGTSVKGAPPKLSWESVAKAAYYNVVITRDGKRVATGWPTSTSWTPPRLKAGRYRWYVWPGFGPKDAARYGRLIGTSTFTVH
jgi:hypothetical protein